MQAQIVPSRFPRNNELMSCEQIPDICELPLNGNQSVVNTGLMVSRTLSKLLVARSLECCRTERFLKVSPCFSNCAFLFWIPICKMARNFNALKILW